MQVGPYRIVREVARGGMGVVYEAVDADGQAVAVKLLLEQRAQDPRTRKRFLTEIQALARLRHPNLVPILGAGEHDGVPWFALDYVEGESLQARLRRGPLPIQEALRVGQQLAQALAYVHGCGVLHRDLKPDNVLLQGDQALLTDFGLARDDDTQLSRITRSGQFLGTPGYWPPEQARGELDAVGPHSDVYGLGGVIYACLTGRPPVEASGLAESINLTVRGRITPARELRPDTPAWLDALCSRCLATDPAQRPASAEEVARALVSAPRDVPARSDRRVWITLATVACLALGSLGLAAWLWSQRGPTPVTAERARAARSWLLQAQGEAAAKRFAPARAAVERALELDPGLTAAYLLRATLRREADDPAGALADLGQAAQLGSDDAADHVGLGEAYAELGEATAALTAFERALALDPECVAARVGRGALHAARQAWAKARADLDVALRLAPEHAAALRLRGPCLVELGAYAEAEADLSSALGASPDWAAGYRARGRARSQLGRGPAALADFERALTLTPDDPRTLAARAQAHLRAERPFLALQDQERVVQLDPGAAAQLGLAEVLVALQRYQEAIEAYGAALAADPRSTAAYEGRAAAYSRLKLYAEAEADLCAALKLSDSEAALYTARGLVRVLLDRRDEALQDLQRATQLDPESEPAQRSLALELLERERFAEALTASDAAVRHAPASAPAHYARGRALQGLGRPEEALPELDAAVRLAPDSERYREARGTLHGQLGDPEAAEADFGEAIRLAPSEARHRRSRAVQRQLRRRYRLAAEDYDVALRLEPEHAPSLLARGHCHTFAQDYEAALRDYREAARLAPRDPTAHDFVGVALSRLERYPEAVEAYTRSLEVEPTARAYRDRGNARFELKAYAEALADFEAALALDPRDADALTRAGDCKLELGQSEASLADFERALELDPSSARALEGVADACAHLLRMNETLAAYERLIALEPSHAPYYVDRATLLAFTRPTLALKDLQRAFLEGIGKDEQRALQTLNMLKAGALQRLDRGAGPRHAYRVVGPRKVAQARLVGEGLRLERGEAGALAIEPSARAEPGRGLPYRLLVDLDDGRQLSARGTLVDMTWSVQTFPFKADPRLQTASWRREAATSSVSFSVPRLHLPFGEGGPSELPDASQALRAAELPHDRFGTIATARVTLPAGRWTLESLSDDGVRVWVDDEVLIDEWTYHVPTRHRAELTLEAPRTVVVRVEHFELTGYAVLELDLLPADRP